MEFETLAVRFGLGSLAAEPVVAAVGWGGRNRVWRCDTTAGVVAVKQLIPQLVPEDVATAFRIERAAHRGGVPCPEPIPTLSGECFEFLDGYAFRVHAWIDGQAKVNEDTTPLEASRMGKLVAQLHRLDLEVPELPAATGFGRDHWLGLAARSPASPWSALVTEFIDRIVAAEGVASTFTEDHPIGSHNDLNAHNVLFSGQGLALIDWDGAGPSSARYERAATPTLWARRRDGSADLNAAVEFLRAYKDAGGVVSVDDPFALVRWLGGLVWWTERNLQIALARPSMHNDQLAVLLVEGVAAGLDTVSDRQHFLASAIRLI